MRISWAVSLALLAHVLAFVVLSIAVGQHGTPLKLPPRVASREQAEHLRFVTPASPAPTVRNSSIGRDRRQRPVTADVPRGTLTQPAPDTGASATAAEAPAAGTPAVGPAAGSLAAALPVDPRLLVVPAPGNVADARTRAVNASIASSVRVLEDSVARARRRWTVGTDTTHRFGIASCGIVVSVICIPFRFGGSLPNPATSRNGIDPTSVANEAEVRAAIARIRPTEPPGP